MNYITNMLAKPNKIRVTQFGDRVDCVDKGMELYLKNSFVCLYSAKLYNKTAKCILFVSFELPLEWKERFEKAGIEIEFVEFGGYTIGDEFNWGIVQYRYDVMKRLCEMLEDNDKVVMLDTDIVCVGELNQVFDELETRMLLYDVQHNYELVDRRNICNNYRKIYQDIVGDNIIHYGGEFIGANGRNLRILFDMSVEVMKASGNVKDLVNFNDEHITSIAIDKLWNKIRVNNANAYICRYWTARKFYLTGTNYCYNPVVLWHMPVEKDRGIRYLYEKVRGQFGKLSDEEMIDRFFDRMKLSRIFGLPLPRRSHKLMNYYIQLRYRK